MIWLLVSRYMKLNKRRTAAAVFGIALAVVALTVVTSAAASMSYAAEQMEISENGGWHARFHHVSEEQRKALASWDKAKESYTVRECEEHKEGVCVDVVMKHPGIMTIGSTQKFAEKIGMPRLPEEEWTEGTGHEKICYPVSYHDELLEFHGVFSQGAEGTGAVTLTVIIVIIIFFSIFIYNSFAISAIEKMRYIGMLGSVGATKCQKSACVFAEGILEAAIGIPCGFLIGISAGKVLVQTAGGSRFLDQKLAFVMGPKQILIIFGYHIHYNFSSYLWHTAAAASGYADCSE